MAQQVATKGCWEAQRSRPSAGEKRAFLDHLAATGSVREAAQAVSITPLQAYAACRRDRNFAEQWRAALRVGYDRLEAMLIERSAAVLAGQAAGPLETPDVLFALRLIERQRETQTPADAQVKKPRAGGADRTDAAILKRLAILAKRQAAEALRAQAGDPGAAGGGDA